MADWQALPELILAQIYSHLSVLDRVLVSRVCRSWVQATTRSQVWRNFELSELNPLFMTANDDNRYYNEGIENRTDLYSYLIGKFGKYFWNVKFYFVGGEETLHLLKCMTENCVNIKHIKLQMFGSQQNICKTAVCCLLQRNPNLKTITVMNLDRLTTSEKGDPVPIGLYHSRSLKKLWIENSFRKSNLSNLMYLVHLRELAIEPCYLSYSMLFHLAGQSLRDIHIVALSKTTEFYNEALNVNQWNEICKQGPKLRVHCLFGVSHKWIEKDVILKSSMPVKSMIYQKCVRLNYLNLTPLVCNYGSTLQTFIDCSMSIKYAAQRASDIPVINRNLLQIVRSCPNLQTLAVKETLSSCTILAMVYINRSLTNLYVMDQQLTYKLVAGIASGLTEDCLEFVENNWTAENFSNAVSSIVGFQWKPLQTSQYMDILIRRTALSI